MIHHSVVFKLKYPKGSSEENRFIDAAAKLSEIPGVLNFKVLKQVSIKNQFDYGLSMDFNNQEEYDTYSAHADHVAFIEQFWLEYVTDFLEIDYVAY
jgi:hypothetical protein